jgi:hypothetical protein
MEEFSLEILNYFSRNLPKRSLELKELTFYGREGFPGKESSAK